MSSPVPSPFEELGERPPRRPVVRIGLIAGAIIGSAVLVAALLAGQSLSAAFGFVALAGAVVAIGGVFIAGGSSRGYWWEVGDRGGRWHAERLRDGRLALYVAALAGFPLIAIGALGFFVFRATGW